MESDSNSEIISHTIYQNQIPESKLVLCKVTNDPECHHGFQYQDGLNILIEPFADKGSCCPGGFYFSSTIHIHKWLDYGNNLRIITLPKTDPDFRCVADDDKWRTNKIIFGQKMS